MRLNDFLDRVRSSLPVRAPLDPGFLPFSAFLAQYRAGLAPENSLPVGLSIERAQGHISSLRLRCYADQAAWGEVNNFLLERLTKTLLWAYGGFRIVFGGPASIGQALQKAYAPGGSRDFDYHFMSRVYEQPLTIALTDYDKLPKDLSGAQAVGRHLDGCRIGFDAGGSDRKVSAVVEGEVVYSEEVVWHPKTQSDPNYHYEGILSALQSAASHMPRVDAIGVSSAGIYVANRTMVASLFLKVPEDLFNQQVKDIYIRAAKAMGDVPLEVANDGDVTALAGAIDLEDNSVLGIAMGTSEAGGFVDGDGNITGWLNELAFVPVDLSGEAMADEWSGDIGCGVKYFSQDAVSKLAPAAGIALDEGLSPAEKLKAVQKRCEQGDEKALEIFDTIGVYLGYAIAFYAELYALRHVLILGRVTSGEGGQRILNHAQATLAACAPALSAAVALHLPDESNRRVGQSIAAASLPQIG